jgi:hypothetical protein
MKRTKKNKVILMIIGDKKRLEMKIDKNYFKN